MTQTEITAKAAKHLQLMLRTTCTQPASLACVALTQQDPFTGAHRWLISSCMAVSPNGKIHMGWQNWWPEDVDPNAGVINAWYSQNGSSYIVLTLDHLTTGIPAAEQQSAYTVYPNPASEFINITTDLAETFVICNSFGQEVLTQTSNSTQARIDVSALPGGVYYLRTVSGEYVQSFAVAR